jgi:hypothetical protein
MVLYIRHTYIYNSIYRVPRTAVELHLPGLIGSASHTNMQKIRIIVFLNRLHIYLHTNKTLMHNSLYVFNSWGKILSHKTMQYSYSKKMFTRKVKPIRITCVRVSGGLLYKVLKLRLIPRKHECPTHDISICHFFLITDRQ